MIDDQVYEAIIKDEGLMHHGILKQKWGVRRFQNPDGSYTAAGKIRYGKGKKDSSEGKKKDFSKAFDQTIKNGKDKAPISPSEKMLKDTKNIIDEGSKIYDSAGRLRNRNKVSPAKSMSDAELQKVINRMQLEQRYDQLSQSSVNNGTNVLKEVLAIGGSSVAIAGGLVSIYVQLKKL